MNKQYRVGFASALTFPPARRIPPTMPFASEPGKRLPSTSNLLAFAKSLDDDARQERYPCLAQFARDNNLAPDTLIAIFELERIFHELILAEKDAAARRRLNKEVYGKTSELVGPAAKIDLNAQSSPKDALVALLENELSGRSILDIGCGAGDFLLSCSRKIAHGALLGIDTLVRDMQVPALNLSFRHCDVVNFTVDSPFDVAITDNVYEHVAPIDVDAHLESIWNALKPGGTAIIVTPHRLFGPWDVTRIVDTSHSGRVPPQGSHINETTYSELARKLLDFGFSDLRSIPPKVRLGFRKLPATVPTRLFCHGERRPGLMLALRGMDKLYRFQAFEICIIATRGYSERGRLTTEMTFPALNSPEYWDERFRTDWEAKLGREQTTFFADQIIKHLPDWLAERIVEDHLSIYDFGCAEGEALARLAARFPHSKLSAGDASSVAVDIARSRYPQFSFDVLPAETPVFSADVVISSNTLEHFADWRNRLEQIASLARHSLVLLIPFQEREPIEPEHMATFDFGSLPPRLVCGARLVFHAVIDTADLPDTRWAGRQVLAVWTRADLPVDVPEVTEFEAPTRLDLRSTPPSAIPHVMAVAKISDRELRIQRDRAAAFESDLNDARRQHEFERNMARHEIEVLKRNSAETLAVIKQNSAIEVDVARGNKEWVLGLLEKERVAAGQLHQEMIDYAKQLAADKTKVEQALATALTREQTEREAHERILAATRKDHASALQELRSRAADDRQAAAATLQSVKAQLALEQENAANARAQLVSEQAQQAQHLQSVLKSIHEIEERHNRVLEGQQHSLQVSIDTLRANFARVVGMTSFRFMMKLLRLYGRLRGILIGLPTVPERILVQLDRVDTSALAPQIDDVAQSLEGRAPTAAAELALAGSAAPPANAPAQESPCILMQLATLDRGGVEQVAYDLVRGLAKRDRRVVTVVTESGGEIANKLSEMGHEVLVLGSGTPQDYANAIAKYPIEGAITHHSYVGLEQLKARGVPIIETVHNYYHWHQNTAPSYVHKTRPVAKRVAVSAGVAEFHAELFKLPRAGIEVIRNPINTEGLIRPERQLLERARRNWRNSFVFINVAQFFPAKAQAGLISAFEIVHRRHPQTRLRLVGGFPDPEVKDQILAQIEATGLQGAIELPGFVDRRTISRLYATSHVFVQPSVYEGFSIAMAEAAHFALPMILTRIGGAMDIVKDGDCGILIPPHFESLIGRSEVEIFASGRNPTPPNLAALADAMENMIKNYDDWMQRGFIAQARIDEITIDAVADRYIEILTRLQTSNH